MRVPIQPSGLIERAGRGRGAARSVAAAILLAFSLLPGIAPAECIDYGDFIHWAGSVDTPGSAAGVDLSDDLAYAFVADGSSGLEVIRLADPMASRDRWRAGHTRLRLRPGCLWNPRLHRGLRERASG